MSDETSASTHSYYVDPETGEVLSSESVYQNAQTARALNRALTALEYVEEKERNRHKLPGNAGKSWTRDEEQQVCEELQNRAAGIKP